jgi:hypothetical protein
MSFDARSLERLKQLGRSLPQPLPQPEPAPAAPTASERRHRVETETDPEALFRELMQVSPDGSVPPHLMERLRQAEANDRDLRRRQAQLAAGSAASGAGTATTGRGAQPRSARQPQRRGELRRPLDSETQELYTAFQHLLLEDDEDDPAG